MNNFFIRQVIIIVQSIQCCDIFTLRVLLLGNDLDVKWLLGPVIIPLNLTKDGSVCLKVVEPSIKLNFAIFVYDTFLLLGF